MVHTSEVPGPADRAPSARARSVPAHIRLSQSRCARLRSTDIALVTSFVPYDAEPILVRLKEDWSTT